MRIFSYGGGVQSTAVLCLAAFGRIQYDRFVFANVGNDSENPATLEYIERYAKPFAEAHGLSLIKVQKHNRAGEVQTLKTHIMNSKRSVSIPAWSNGGFGNRKCTGDFKISIVGKWTKANGATKNNPAIIGIGFSTDEWTRAGDSRILWQKNEFPLLDLGYSRNDCRKIIADAGLPVPPKSACWFCPFHMRRDWEKLRREEPELFLEAVKMDNYIRTVRQEIGRDPIYLHKSCHPLEKAVGLQYEFDLREDDLPCDTGYCFL